MGFGFFAKPKRGRPKKHFCKCYHNVFPNLCKEKSPVRTRDTSGFDWKGESQVKYCDFLLE